MLISPPILHVWTAWVQSAKGCILIGSTFTPAAYRSVNDPLATQILQDILIESIRRVARAGWSHPPPRTWQAGDQITLPYPGNYSRIATLSAWTGLESPIVFLVGLRELFEEEQSLRLSDDEREDIIRDNTRKIYMAATRVGQRLVFTDVGDLPSALKEIIKYV